MKVSKKMKRIKCITLILMILALVLIIPNISSAAEGVSVTREVYSNNGSMKFNFKGLTLDMTHEYEFGLTKTAATEVEKWYLITEYTETTAVVNILTTTSDFRNVVNAVDTGYITIKDKTADTVILQPYSIDLKIPFLRVTDYTVVSNGKSFGIADSKNIHIGLRNAHNSEAYYQYEKITDTNIINKYKEIKSKNGDFIELESMLKTTPPNSNWTTWSYWNGYDLSGMNGVGHPQSEISLSENGLYYMWVYFSGNNIKNVYGYILVDNLEPEIALDSISLPKTEEVKLGKTLKLTPTFNPVNTTNKIVTWSSSDETVATVDNAGNITPKKIGSTIITVTSQDGNKKATCTVTVTEDTTTDNKNNTNNNTTTDNKNNTNNNTTTDNKNNNTTTDNKNNSNNNTTTNNKNNVSTSTETKKDNTTASGKLPQTGISTGISFAIVIVIASCVFAYFKYNKLRDI